MIVVELYASTYESKIKGNSKTFSEAYAMQIAKGQKDIFASHYASAYEEQI